MWLQKEIKDPKMREKLRPNFKLGCKRILISDEYYNRMNDKHFTLDNTKILNINKDGIKTAEAEHKLEAIVYATGFLLKENFGIIFDHNPKMAEIANDPDLYGSYYGTFHPEVPNFATFLGPMTGLGHNSIIFMIECQM